MGDLTIARGFDAELIRDAEERGWAFGFDMQSNNMGDLTLTQGFRRQSGFGDNEDRNFRR